MTLTTRQSDKLGAAPVQAKGASGTDTRAALRGKSYDEQVQMLTPEGDTAAPAATETKAGGMPAQPSSQVDAEGWSEQYKTTNAKGKKGLHGHSGTYEEYKAFLDKQGETKESSAGGGKVVEGPVTMEQMLVIFDGVHTDLQTGKVAYPVVESLLNECNTAFRVMKINTVEARAAFFANAYSESAQFRSMTETALSEKDQYATDPRSVDIDEQWLEGAARGEKKGVGGYQAGGTIHAQGGAGWDESFIGRGATQVTHRDYYIQMIAIMEKRLGEMPEDDPDRAQLSEAIDAIKRDPQQAANPRYAFLFSAAHMKMPTNDKGGTADKSISGGADPTSHMGPQDKQKPKKLAAFKRAKEEFMRQHELEKRGRPSDQGHAPDWLYDEVNGAPAGQAPAE